MLAGGNSQCRDRRDRAAPKDMLTQLPIIRRYGDFVLRQRDPASAAASAAEIVQQRSTGFGWIVGHSETAAGIARRGPTSASVIWNYRTLFSGSEAPAVEADTSSESSGPATSAARELERRGASPRNQRSLDDLSFSIRPDFLERRAQGVEQSLVVWRHPQIGRAHV